MRTAPPPENLPVEPAFSPEELAHLRTAFAQDFGGDTPTDDELIALARETIQIVRTLARIAPSQAARRNERGQ